MLFRSDLEEKSGYINGFLLNQGASLPDSLAVQLQKLNFISVRIVFGIQVVVFLIYGKKLVFEYSKRINNFYSNLEHKNLHWVNVFLYSFIFTALMSTIFNIIGRSIFLESKILLLIPSFIFSVILFFIGYIGSLQNHTVYDLEQDSISNGMTGIRKYTNEQLTKDLLQLFVAQKIYRNPELKITDVAQLLGTNRTYVSELINSEFSCSFVEYVNRYRFNEAKRLFNTAESERFSLQEISEHSGFGSPGTFIRIFRQFEGITPGKYRDLLISHTDKDSNLKQLPEQLI